MNTHVHPLRKIRFDIVQELVTSNPERYGYLCHESVLGGLT